MNRFIVLTLEEGKQALISPLHISMIVMADRDLPYRSEVRVEGAWAYALETPDEILQKISEWAKSS